MKQSPPKAPESIIQKEISQSTTTIKTTKPQCYQIQRKNLPLQVQILIDRLEKNNLNGKIFMDLMQEDFVLAGKVFMQFNSQDMKKLIDGAMQEIQSLSILSIAKRWKLQSRISTLKCSLAMQKMAERYWRQQEELAKNKPQQAMVQQVQDRQQIMEEEENSEIKYESWRDEQSFIEQEHFLVFKK